MPSINNAQTLLDITSHAFSEFSTCTLVANVDGEAITYAQAQQKIEILQAKLVSLGIEQGDKVAICSENMPHWGIAYLAITTMGAVAVPILPDFHSNEIHHIVKHSEAKGIFVSEKMSNKLAEDDFTSSLKFVLSLESLRLLEDYASKNELLLKGSEKLAQFRAKLSKSEQPEKKSVSINKQDLAVIIYTSGTTGQSKGVMLSHDNLVSQIKQADKLIKILPEDRFLSILPLAHTFECSIGFLVPFCNGSSIFYISKTPAPKIILKAMTTVKPTCMLSVPLVIEKIYKSKVQASFNKNAIIKYLYNHVGFIRKKLNKIAGAKLVESFGGEIRFFGIGGAKLSPYVEQFLQEANFPYAIGYGLTETAPIIAGAIPGNTAVGTTGIIVDRMETRFVQHGQEGGDAELHVRGPNVMMGYYKDKTRTDEVLDKDGWLNTGDLGQLDENGILSINGRSKNVIIGASGENIYPEAVESIINQNELVVDSLVYELEGKVVAKIHIDYDLFDETHNIKKTSDSALHTEILAALESIKNEANTQLANYSKIMTVFEQSEPFIKTPTKKIKRYLHI
ncbi:long-chain fatty acid--CoA ligase [Psychromonas sp. psych-6C06]|uniref:AMP-binding protein n=1 Tax=Psychromonas sp. psych-6C06 TaxID=2058089 RepID=UPI000C33DCE9|nr:AMP-binding protein [Psychromonas sp. psych-6C06]PKF62164.1 long-chain fatty acid--CoA ligase [Psychromonas sp. psych-6C06]